MVVEAANPSGENPEHYQDQQSRSNIVHDCFEVALVFGTLSQFGSAADEGLLGCSGDDGVCLAAFTPRCVVDDITEIFFDGQGLASNC